MAFITTFAQSPLHFPEVGFELTTYVISKAAHISYASSAILLLSVTITIIGILLFSIFKKFLLLSDGLGFVFTFILMVVSPILFPLFNHFLYLGQWSPNPWHSPTFLLMTPFAIATTVLSISVLLEPSRKRALLAALLLLCSQFYKPSFAIIFIPAVCLYAVAFHRENLLQDY